jgi:hypothetical protein
MSTQPIPPRTSGANMSSAPLAEADRQFIGRLLANPLTTPPEAQRVTILLAFYHQVCDEIKRYRDYEWNIVVWTISLITGVIALTRVTPVPIPVEHRPIIKAILSVFTILAALYGFWHLHYVHRNLTYNRNLQRTCERILGLYDNGIFAKNSLLPVSWRNKRIPYTRGLLSHLLSWGILIILAMSYAIYSIIFLY